MNTEDLKIVLKVAEFKSITKAATALDLRTATASAAVKRVEQSLGAELFIRTTRQLKISVEGEHYLPECERALATLAQAAQNLKNEQGIVEGEIRLGISSDLGRNIVLPWLDEFIDQHNNVAMKVHLSDSNIDFYRDPVDIALRYGSPSDASMYGFKICDVPRILCASPEYLQHHEAPSIPMIWRITMGCFINCGIKSTTPGSL